MTDMEHKKVTTELELIRQVGEWAEKNFDKHYPEMGVIEEIGEAAHAVLKNLQGIRGYDKYKFESEFADSLGDAMIYLSHWCFLNNAFFQFERCSKSEAANIQDQVVLQHLLQAASQLFSDYSSSFKGIGTDPSRSYVAQKVVQALMYWACKYDMDLVLITAATWAKVSKRDWKTNPDGMVKCPRCHGDGCDYCQQAGNVKV